MSIDLTTLPISYSLTSSLSQSYWDNFRASLSNNLAILETSLDPENIYSSVFNKIPHEGNCWCFSDKHNKLAKKGQPQDAYDEACKEFHSCLTCGSFKSDVENEGQITGNAFGRRLGLDTNFTIDVKNVDSLKFSTTKTFGFYDLFNYDGTDEMEVYSWSCSSSNSQQANNICQCFKKLEDDFVLELLDDINYSSDPDNEIEIGYEISCSNVHHPGGQHTPPDSCCGESAPYWSIYFSNFGRRGCCGDLIFDGLAMECCENGNVAVIGKCPVVTTTEEPTTSTDMPTTTTTTEIPTIITTEEPTTTTVEPTTTTTTEEPTTTTVEPTTSTDVPSTTTTTEEPTTQELSEPVIFSKYELKVKVTSHVFFQKVVKKSSHESLQKYFYQKSQSRGS